MDESEKVDEHLTDEERALLAGYPWPGTPVDAALSKLLRLHDRYKARVEELERWLEKANARIEYLVLQRPEEVAELERFAALAILTHWDAEGEGGPREPPEWPVAVKELTEQFNGYDVSHCTRCGLWAPTQRPSHTCAPGWGCARGPVG